MAAYYSYYYFEAKRGETVGSIAAASLAVVCLLSVAFIFSNNMTLVLTPARWLSMYRAHPDGVNLNLAEHSLLPRYLHTLVGAVALFAAATCHIGCHRLKKEPEYGEWLVRRWSLVFGAATGVQILLGLWFLLSLPHSVALYFLSDGLGATVFGLGLLFALAAMILILVGGHTSRPARFVHAGFGLTIAHPGPDGRHAPDGPYRLFTPLRPTRISGHGAADEHYRFVFRAVRAWLGHCGLYSAPARPSETASRKLCAQQPRPEPA